MPSRFKASISPMLGSPARVAEGICDAIEESEQGCDVYSFGNLSFFPFDWTATPIVAGKLDEAGLTVAERALLPSRFQASGICGVDHPRCLPNPPPTMLRNCALRLR